MAQYVIPQGTNLTGFVPEDNPGYTPWGTHSLTVAGNLGQFFLTNFYVYEVYNENEQYYDEYLLPTTVSWDVTVSGTGRIVVDPEFTNSPAMYFGNFDSPDLNTLTVEQNGRIQSSFVGVMDAANTAIVNAGAIVGGFNAIQYYGGIFDANPSQVSSIVFGDVLSLRNETSGTIQGGYTGVLNMSYGRLSVVNRGGISTDSREFFGPPSDIESAVPNYPYDYNLIAAISTAGRLSLVNIGDIDGGIKMSWHTNSITNTGTIFGSIYATVLTDAQGRVDTNGDRDFTDAGDRSAALLTGTTITNSGLINGTVVTNQEFSTQIAIVTSDARDTVINTAQTISSRGGYIYGSVDLGGGADRLENAGSIFGNVFMGDGTDTVINSIGARITSTVYLGNGKDAITNAGFMANPALTETGMGLVLDAGDGNDVFVNAAFGQIGFAGDPNPNFVLVNPLQYIARISPDFFFNPGVLVDMGAGNDIVSNEGVIWGVVDLGTGNDTFTGGNRFDLVADEAGRDVYELGGDGDVFYMRGEDFSVDTINGGDGIDLIFLQDFDYDNSGTSGTTINLNKGIMRTGDLGARIDIVTGFEQVVGTNGNDYFIGSARAETLVGGFGDDTISGGGGKDLMVGGDGADVFVFNRITDSRVGWWQRDVVHGLGDDAGDSLHLRFDTNSDIAGTQELTLFMTDIYSAGLAFSGAGSLRHSYLDPDSGPIFEGATRVLLELDINGDGWADFGVEVAYFPLA